MARLHPKAKHRSALGRLIPTPAQTFSKSQQHEREKLPQRRERMFAGIDEVRGKLNIVEREIMEQIESLRLLWAFNFATGDKKTFLRIYKPALQHWLDHKISLPATLNELLDILFPAANLTTGVVDTISGVEFQEVFNLSQQNTSLLLHARWILARDNNWGNGITPRILMPSVVAFLKRRQLP